MEPGQLVKIDGWWYTAADIDKYSTSLPGVLLLWLGDMFDLSGKIGLLLLPIGPFPISDYYTDSSSDYWKLLVEEEVYYVSERFMEKIK